jgi:multiple sugar transport system substrate-binding protein
VACAPAATPAPTAAPPTAQPAAQPTAAPAAAGAASSTGPIALGISVWGDVTDKETYDKITTDYMKANPSIKVTPDQWVGDYYQKLQVVLAGGTAPDVIYTESYSWQGYAARGAFAPIDSYKARDKITSYWPDLPLFHAYTEFRGKLYSVTVDTGNCVTFYAKDIFDKAGVPYPKPDWTWDDYFQTAQKLTDSKTKVFGAHQQWNYLLSQAIWRAAGALEFDTVNDPKQAKFNDPVIADTLQLWAADAVNKLKVSPAPASIQGGSMGLQQGNVAMYHTGPWFLPQLWGPNAKKEGGVKFDVVFNPRNPKSGKTAHFTDASNEQLNAKSKYLDQAWELVKYIASEPAQMHVVEGGRMPSTPDLTNKLWVERAKKDYNFQNAEVFVKAYETGVQPMCGGVTVAELNQKAFRPALDAMFNGTDAKTALADCQKNAQKMLDDYWATQK